MDRRAELRDRAEKIKAKEERRKANKEKRGMKLERDKEAKERQGFQEPALRLPERQITLNGFVKRPEKCLQFGSRTDNSPDVKETKFGELRGGVTKPSSQKEVKQKRQVRFVEPEIPSQVRLPLRLKSPPMASNPSVPQSASQEQIPKLEIGSPLVKLNYYNATEDEYWASLFPSDTQVGRELRSGSPLLDDEGFDCPQQPASPSGSPNVDDKVLENYAEELLLSQSVWDLLPSDSQVQRELDESPLLLPARLDHTDSCDAENAPLVVGSGKGTFKWDVKCKGLQKLDEGNARVSSQEICPTSGFGMPNLTDNEAESGNTTVGAGGLKAWSMQWLPSSTAEISAFFDSNIDD